MKKIVILVASIMLFGSVTFADEVLGLVQLAARSQEGEYLEARRKIFTMVTNSIPRLMEMTRNDKLSWQERLVARICCERLLRGEDIVAFRACEWRKNDDYNQSWERTAGGVSERMFSYGRPYLQAHGVWYHCIELTWKQTAEYATPPLHRIAERWPRWCRRVIAGQPEEYFLRMVMIDRLKNDQHLEALDTMILYKELVNQKSVDAVPLLIQRYNAYYSNTVAGPEVYAGRHKELYNGMFLSIISFANNDHIPQIANFVAKNIALSDIQARFPDIQSRPAPAPMPEPAFPPKGQEEQYLLKADWKPVEDYSLPPPAPVFQRPPPSGDVYLGGQQP